MIVLFIINLLFVSNYEVFLQECVCVEIFVLFKVVNFHTK